MGENLRKVKLEYGKNEKLPKKIHEFMVFAHLIFWKNMPQFQGPTPPNQACLFTDGINYFVGEWDNGNISVWPDVILKPEEFKHIKFWCPLQTFVELGFKEKEQYVKI